MRRLRKAFVTGLLLVFSLPVIAGPIVCYAPNIPGNGMLCCKDGECWVVHPK
jgi:hypothetical protein